MRDYYDKEIKPELSEEGNEVINVSIKAYKEGSKKVISKLYQGLQKQKGDNTEYIRLKWEKEFEIEISQEDWHLICETQHSTTCPKRWREFVWKNLSRFFITPQIKSK